MVTPKSFFKFKNISNINTLSSDDWVKLFWEYYEFHVNIKNKCECISVDKDCVIELEDGLFCQNCQLYL